MIPYGKHTVNQDDIDAVVRVIKQEFLTQGSQVPAFEQALCDYTGARHAIAVNSGTSGLHIACLAAGVGAGDCVWTTPVSFAASANCALYCGAQVDFVDIDAVTRNMSLTALQQKLAKASEQGTLPKAIVVVHFTGSSCDMKAIRQLVQDYPITLIEDAAHALGAQDADGAAVGACCYSDMAVMSFHPVKSITTAEGGAVLTNDDVLAHKLRLFASHGISKQSALLGPAHQQEPWFYAQFELGFNYRLSDLHAALGRSQMTRLDAFIAARRERVEHYQSALSSLPLTLPQPDPHSAWHIYVVELKTHDRTEIFNLLRERGIGVNVHYIPIHLHPYYQALGFAPGQFPVAEAYYNKAITLPLYPELSADNQNTVVQVLKEVLV